MHSLKTSQIKDEAVKITWCACAVCSADGPRFMTLIRNHREYTVELDTHCCGLKSGDSSIRMEDALIARNPSPIDRFAR